MTFVRPCRLAAFAFAASIVSGTSVADVVAVVSSTSAVTTLSKAQITDIFLGKVNRFPDGVPALPIDQWEGSKARDEFYWVFAGKSPAQVKAHWAKIIFTGRGQPPTAAANSGYVKKMVAANPNAIGYLERSEVDGKLKILRAP